MYLFIFALRGEHGHTVGELVDFGADVILFEVRRCNGEVPSLSARYS